jgi:hypothetical protein
MNLNIEGTKHEKAVIVILSYVVGFTAGFITFGVTGMPSMPAEPAVTVPVSEVAAPIANTNMDAPMEEVAPVEEVSAVNEVVSYIDGRLTANINGAAVLLSAQKSTVDPETAEKFAGQGVHTNIPAYEASADGSYVYYCEQHSADDSCSAFVYNVNTEAIHKVTIDGVAQPLTVDQAQFAVWTEAGLMIGDAISNSLDAPWNLVSTQ